MWLIFTAQLCRAIAARLAPQKKKEKKKKELPPFIFFSSPTSHHFCPRRVPQFGPLLSAHGYAALNCYFGKMLA